MKIKSKGQARRIATQTNSKTRVVVSGGFDPLHKGHVDLFEEASKLGELTVIVNSDKFLYHKKGYIFMPLEERIHIVHSIKYVAHVMEVIDTDDTVCETLRVIKPNIFCNGGDRNKKNIPEVELCKEMNIKMMFNVGGTKIQSSSELVDRIIKHMREV